MNPTVLGIGGNASHPHPVQPERGNAPASSKMTVLGDTSQIGTGGNTSSTPSSAAVGNDTDQDPVANLLEEFQKIMRSEQKGLSPEFAKQSPQEKYLRAMSLLDPYTIGRMEDRDNARALNQATKIEESWLHKYLDDFQLDSALAPAQMVLALEGIDDCKGNIQFVAFGEKVVAVTSPEFLIKNVKPAAMLRQVATDLIIARSKLDQVEGDDTEYQLTEQDHYNMLANHFSMVNTSENDKDLDAICLHIREVNFEKSSKFDCKMRNLLAKEFKFLNTRAQNNCAGGAATGTGRPRRAEATSFGVL